jgi:hypothetical protein
MKEIKPNLVQVTHYEVLKHEPIDMVVVRQYTAYGIAVLVRLDRHSKTATIVEWDKNTNSYKPKSFRFEKREVAYMDGWVAIFRAMENAIQEAKIELEKYDDEEMQKLVAMHVALNEVELKDESN